MSEKFDKYSQILTSLVEEAISCTPTSWSQGVLTIECDGTRIDYKLKNESSEDKALISEKLKYLCEMYWVEFKDNGEAWLKSEVSFQSDNGEWKFNASYKYPDKPKIQTWKFWQ